MLDPTLAEFLEEGLAIQIGTCDRGLDPHGSRAVGARVDPDRQHVVVYVPAASARPILADLASVGRAAVAFVRPSDDRACQVKGTFVTQWDATAGERADVMRQWDGFLGQLAALGIPLVALKQWHTWPLVAVRLRVTDVFDQTPGPGAGGRLP